MPFPCEYPQVEWFLYLKLLTVRRGISFISEKLDQLEQMFSCFQKFIVKETIKIPQRGKNQPKPILRAVSLPR